MTKPKWGATVQNIVACNCNWGCPCPFDAPPTFAHCEGVVAPRVVTGTYGSLTLDGLKWLLVMRWPGAKHERSCSGLGGLDAHARASARGAVAAVRCGRAPGPR